MQLQFSSIFLVFCFFPQFFPFWVRIHSPASPPTCEKCSGETVSWYILVLTCSDQLVVRLSSLLHLMVEVTASMEHGQLSARNRGNMEHTLLEFFLSNISVPAAAPDPAYTANCQVLNFKQHFPKIKTKDTKKNVLHS